MLLGATETELCLVKMYPDTPFKGVLERLRQDHPRKQLKIEKTGTFVFETDSPAYVSLDVLHRVGLYLMICSWV